MPTVTTVISGRCHARQQSVAKKHSFILFVFSDLLDSETMQFKGPTLCKNPF